MEPITPESVKESVIESLKELDSEFDALDPKNQKTIDLFVKRKMYMMWDMVNYIGEDDHDALYDIIDGNYE